jgi:hypothetical protein
MGTCLHILRTALIAAALVALAGGCSASGRVRTSPDGTASVDCPGGYHDWSACHAAAKAHCRGRDYQILSQISDEGSSGVGTRDWSRQGSSVTRTMLFRCNAGPASRAGEAPFPDTTGGLGTSQ